LRRRVGGGGGLSNAKQLGDQYLKTLTYIQKKTKKKIWDAYTQGPDILEFHL
jgi:hypothetical protein